MATHLGPSCKFRPPYHISGLRIYQSGGLAYSGTGVVRINEFSLRPSPLALRWTYRVSM